MAVYVKFEGIDGDATHESHKKWLTVESVQWGVSRSISAPVGATRNRETSEPAVSDVMITRSADAASPKLFSESCGGKSGKKVVIDFVTTGNPGDTYLQCTLNDALVSHYTISSAGDRSSESIGLSFTKIEMKYTPYNEKHQPGSPITVTYDLTTTKTG